MLKRRIIVLAVIIVILSAFALGVRFSLSDREVIGQNREDEQLKEVEFLADSQAALDKLYEIKKMVLRYTK